MVPQYTDNMVIIGSIGKRNLASPIHKVKKIITKIKYVDLLSAQCSLLLNSMKISAFLQEKLEKFRNIFLFNKNL